mmetsp:Transcript_105465/g.315005  ORF Transcript_105465/g.315005 Transcript_105465/m.315005 type:complete len:339 (-) Transcript_105465:32-1048(-)
MVGVLAVLEVDDVAPVQAAQGGQAPRCPPALLRPLPGAAGLEAVVQQVAEGQHEAAVLATEAAARHELPRGQQGIPVDAPPTGDLLDSADLGRQGLRQRGALEAREVLLLEEAGEGPGGLPDEPDVGPPGGALPEAPLLGECDGQGGVRGVDARGRQAPGEGLQRGRETRRGRHTAGQGQLQEQLAPLDGAGGHAAALPRLRGRGVARDRGHCIGHKGAPLAEPRGHRGKGIDLLRVPSGSSQHRLSILPQPKAHAPDGDSSGPLPASPASTRGQRLASNENRHSKPSCGTGAMVPGAASRFDGRETWLCHFRQTANACCRGLRIVWAFETNCPNHLC